MFLLQSPARRRVFASPQTPYSTNLQGLVVGCVEGRLEQCFHRISPSTDHRVRDILVTTCGAKVDAVLPASLP